MNNERVIISFITFIFLERKQKRSSYIICLWFCFYFSPLFFLCLRVCMMEIEFSAEFVYTWEKKKGILYGDQCQLL